MNDDYDDPAKGCVIALGLSLIVWAVLLFLWRYVL